MTGCCFYAERYERRAAYAKNMSNVHYVNALELRMRDECKLAERETVLAQEWSEWNRYWQEKASNEAQDDGSPD